MLSVAFKPSPGVVRGFLLYSRIAGALMVLAMLGVCIDWWWGLSWLVLEGFGQQMRLTAAVCFGLAGAAMLLGAAPGRLARGASAALCMAVGTLGATMVVEHFLAPGAGISGVIDRSLGNGVRPGSRMAALAAFAFVLLGGQGFLITRGTWLWLREGLGVAVIAIAMAGMASFGFVLAGEQPNPLFTELPFQTTLLLLLAALGWMSSVPGTGLTRIATSASLGGMVARCLLLPALLLPVGFTFAFKALQAWLGLSEAFVFTLAALFTGATVAWMIWLMATLLDRIERQREESRVLRGNANTDALTGVANRGAFDAALARFVQRRREMAEPFAVLLVDVDHFKAFNDSFGHQAGDEALRIVGRLMSSAQRRNDVVARYGGEEFAVLLADARGNQAMAVATRMLEEFRQYPWPCRALTVSIGVAEGGSRESAESVLRRADQALYHAKRSGRDRAEPAPPEPGEIPQCAPAVVALDAALFRREASNG